MDIKNAFPSLLLVLATSQSVSSSPCVFRMLTTSSNCPLPLKVISDSSTTSCGLSCRLHSECNIFALSKNTCVLAKEHNGGQPGRWTVYQKDCLPTEIRLVSRSDSVKREDSGKCENLSVDMPCNQDILTTTKKSSFETSVTTVPQQSTTIRTAKGLLTKARTVLAETTYSEPSTTLKAYSEPSRKSTTVRTFTRQSTAFRVVSRSSTTATAVSTPSIALKTILESSTTATTDSKSSSTARTITRRSTTARKFSKSPATLRIVVGQSTKEQTILKSLTTPTAVSRPPTTVRTVTEQSTATRTVSKALQTATKDSVLSTTARAKGIFELVTDHHQWGYAMSYCLTSKGFLAVVTSKADNAQAVQLMSEKSVTKAWMGYTEHNGIWQWLPGLNSIYTNWMEGQPNRTSGCALITADGYWMAEPCGQSHSFLCRVKPDQEISP